MISRTERNKLFFASLVKLDILTLLIFSMNNVPLDLRLLDKVDKLPCTWLVQCAHGHVQIAKTMLNTGLMFKKDNNGKTPLDLWLDQCSSHSYGELFQKVTKLVKEHQEEYKINEEELLCLELLFSKLKTNECNEKL